MEVRTVKTLEAAGDCKAVFFPAGEDGSIDPEKLLARGSLVIGETEDFLQRGGIIQLFLDEGKLRFAVHLGNAERAKVKLSSKLLTLARIVR